MKRKSLRNSKISNRSVHRIIDLFSLEVPASRAALFLRLNRNTVTRIYRVIRETLAKECEKSSPFSGEIEVDESYFGGHRKGKRGRGAAGKVPVFGLIKRNGKVSTQIIPNAKSSTLKKIIRGQVEPGSSVFSDSFRSYDGLVLDGFKHYRVNHSKEFVGTSKRNHINGIENFWGYAKTKMKKYYGISRSTFYLFLKEMEFRFNHRDRDLGSIIRKLLLRG